MTTCAKVFDERTRFAVSINLNTVNVAVAQIGNRKVNYTISSKKGESTDRTIILKAFYIYIP
jgi:hypothetical protein